MSRCHNQKAGNWQEVVWQTQSHNRIRRQVSEINMLGEKWLTGPQLQEQLNSGCCKQVSVSTAKRRQAEFERENNCKDVRIRKRGLPGPWTTIANGLLKTRRKSCRLMIQNWKSSVYHTGFLCPIELVNEWLFDINCQTWRMKCDSLGALVTGLVTFRVRHTLNQNSYHSILQHHVVPCGMHIVGQRYPAAR